MTNRGFHSDVIASLVALQGAGLGQPIASAVAIITACVTVVGAATVQISPASFATADGPAARILAAGAAAQVVFISQQLSAPCTRNDQSLGLHKACTTMRLVEGMHVRAHSWRPTDKHDQLLQKQQYNTVIGLLHNRRDQGLQARPDASLAGNLCAGKCLCLPT